MSKKIYMPMTCLESVIIDGKIEQFTSSRDDECSVSTTDKIELCHIGGDYIGVKVDNEYFEITGKAQSIIFELLRRMNLRNRQIRDLRRQLRK